MKKLFLLSLLCINGIFSSEGQLTKYKPLAESGTLQLNGQNLDITADDYNFILGQAQSPQEVHHHHHGSSVWPFAGGVVVTLGTLGVLAYFGWEHIKPDVRLGIGVIQALAGGAARGLEEAAKVGK